MTIRFAAAWGGATPAIVRALCPSAPLDAVNDNGLTAPVALYRFAPRKVAKRTRPAEAGGSMHDLNDALRYFARHGLAAAAKARARAETAYAAGNEPAYRHWITICRQLDRRMASACALTLAQED